MTTLSLTPNYSIYAIPAFYVLAMAPQFYGKQVVLKANNGNFDNSNPRGDNFQSSLKSSLPKETYGIYERAKAAHVNALEALPLFTAAVLAANVAKVEPGVLNAACAGFLALRTAYIPIYIGITDPKLSNVRTAVWMASVGCCLYLLGKAGTVMARGGPLVV